MVKNGRMGEDDNEFADLPKSLRVLPISSAECERGFSCMNQMHTTKRNALEIITLSDLLFIKLNEPPTEHFPAERYASLWLKEGRHSAVDDPSGRAAKEIVIEHYQKLFL